MEAKETVYGIYRKDPIIRDNGHCTILTIYFYDNKKDCAEGLTSKAKYASVMSFYDGKTDENGMKWKSTPELNIYKAVGGICDGLLYEDLGIYYGEKDDENHTSLINMVNAFIAATYRAAKELDMFNIGYIEVYTNDQFDEKWNLRIVAQKEVM